MHHSCVFSEQCQNTRKYEELQQHWSAAGDIAGIVLSAIHTHAVALGAACEDGSLTINYLIFIVVGTVVTNRFPLTLFEQILL